MGNKNNILQVMATYCTRKTVLTLFYANLIFLGIVLVIMYDLNTTDTESHYKKAYERWRKIRDDFDTYSKHKALKDAYLQIKGRQMDVEAGFDLLVHASGSRTKNASDRHSDNKMLSYTSDFPLNFIPKVPEFSEADIVPYLSDNITKKYLKLPKQVYTQKIVILTPVCDVAHVLKNYMLQLTRLSYPHHLISVYFGEDSSSDRTLDMATLLANDLKTKYNFRDAQAYHFNISGGVHGTWGDVHHRSSQHERRAHIAKSRNLLLRVGLKKGDNDYVLWIDSDIKELPADLIQQLLFANSDVVVPSCLFKSGKYQRIFDKNSWRETLASLEDQQNLPKDILVLEGYSQTRRIYLPDLRGEGRVVDLDGVGGCALLIKANCHKRGLIFPERIYSHHIETEGLAKMAQHMGFSVVGVPFVEVFHN